MRRGLGILAWVLGVYLAGMPVAEACTTVMLPASAGKVVGKSLDWHLRHGVAIANPRGLKKSSFRLGPVPAASWTAKYGSLTLHQYGREMPLSGMNEAGLVIEIMWLDSTKYPAADGKPTLTELQWIQYHLDRFDSVADVTRSARELGVGALYAKVHYLACDRTGACATIEYLDGKPVIHEGAALPVPALANDTYAESLEYVKRFVGFGGELKEPVPSSTGSLDRFARAAILSKRYDGSAPAVPYAFGILDAVRQGDYSTWNVVYDRDAFQIHFRTLESPGIKTVDVKAFDYACERGARTFDMNSLDKGNATARFVAYRKETNRRMIDQAIKGIESHFPPQAPEILAAYPDTLSCE